MEQDNVFNSAIKKGLFVIQNGKWNNFKIEPAFCKMFTFLVGLTFRNLKL